MKLKEKIKLLNKTSSLKPLEKGKSYDLDQFWNYFIEPRLPKEAAVRQWHKILKEYVKKEDAIYFMRAYGSYGSAHKSSVLRRGFYNTTNYKFSAFYGDNFFTHIFYSMAFDGYAPKDLNEFEIMMRNRTFPCGCIQTSSERKYAAYFRGNDPRISNKGYKVAHIYSSGEKYNPSIGFKTIGDFCNKVFPRDNNADWDNIGTDKYGEYHYRQKTFETKKEADIARKFLIAHFIRTVHPINYFLVPNKTNTRDKQTGVIKTNIYWQDDNGITHDEIGEYDELIKYVACKIKDKYGKIYDEFLEMIYPDRIITSYSNKVINAEYEPDIWKRNAPIAIIKPAKAKKVVTGGTGFGQYAKQCFINLLEQNKLSQALISQLLDKDYSKQNFGTGYPVLSTTRTPRNKYYKEPVNGYYICNDWFDKNRSKLEDWLKNYLKN